MQKIGNVTKWRPLEADGSSAVMFPGEERVVRIEVTSGEPAKLFIEYESVDDDDKPVMREQFLARIEGFDRLEFTVPGDFKLYVEGSDIMYNCVDGDLVYNVVVAPVIFTRIANRKARNPNLEMMEYNMRLNLERRMKTLEEEALQRLHEKVNRYAPQRNIRTPPGRVGGEPSVEGETGEGGEPSGKAAGEAAADGGKGGKSKAAKQAAAATADD